MRFTVEVDGEKIFDRSFNRLEQGISDFRSIWPGVASTIYGIFGRAFETEGASTAAGKWKALSSPYAKWKAMHYPGEPILQREHSLIDSLTDPEASDAIYRPERDQLTIGSKVPYLRAHQRGTGRLPARPIISFTETDKRDIQKSLQRGLVQFVRGLGFHVEEERVA